MRVTQSRRSSRPPTAHTSSAISPGANSGQLWTASSRGHSSCSLSRAGASAARDAVSKPKKTWASMPSSASATSSSSSSPIRLTQYLSSRTTACRRKKARTLCLPTSAHAPVSTANSTARQMLLASDGSVEMARSLRHVSSSASLHSRAGGKGNRRFGGLGVTRGCS